jgi:S1-C subfamily serine protease
VNILDVLLLVVVAVAAIEGLRLGAVLLTLSFVGFWLGMYLGAILASETVRWVHSQPSRTAVALITMVGSAVVLGTAGRILGGRSFQAVHRRGRLGSVDTVLGVVVAVVASLLAVWLVASTLVNSSYPSLNSTIANSSIIRSLDDVLPAPPSVFSRVQAFLSQEGFPPVFAQLAPASAGPVALPDNAAVRAAAAAAGPSTVKIVGEGCGQIQEGSGFVVAPGLVVTNAHVIAGIAHPTVEDGAGIHDTTVVYFDPSFDLAVLRTDVTEPALALDPETVPRSTQGAVLGYPEGGPFTDVAAGVMAEFQAQGRDIYGQGLTVRDVYEIQAVVRPGNSGGPLVMPNGQVIGVVFSRSTTNGTIGYALTSPGVMTRVHQAESATSAVGTGGCTNG